MSPELREQYRLSLLRVLDEHDSRYGRPIPFIEVALRSRGVVVDREFIDRELRYFEDAGHVEQALKQISPENPHFRITKSGRDFVATH